ncbi:MAG: hypothetical protein LBG06_02795 [Deltaproteobacteria bacterium]|nr:hypothetical protein [Deltaproteobacteria bacterium]
MALFTAAAFVAALAISADRASAESPITFSGYLRLRTIAFGGAMPSNGNLRDPISERYGHTRFRVNVVFKPSDIIEVRWRFHGPHGTRWGNTDSSANNLRSIYFFGVAKTSFGTFRAGRISSDFDSAGLQTLGYLPYWGFSSQALPFDRDSENDGIEYRNDWDNGFGLKMFYMKRASSMLGDGAAVPAALAGQYERSAAVKDGDYDRFSVEPYYKWGTGGVSLALQYDTNKFDYDNTNGGDVGGREDFLVRKNYFMSINPALVQQWDIGNGKTFAIHAEAKYSFGKRQMATPEGGVAPPSQKQDGFGAYLDFTLGYPQGSASLVSWYFRGTDEYGPGANDPRTNPAYHSLVHGGEGFYPFMLFNYVQSYLTGIAQTGGWQTAGNWGVGVLGNHKLNDFVTLNYGIGTFGRTADYFITDTRKASRGMGTEVDLGFVIKILDGLQWQTKFAYYNVGNYYGDRNGRPEWNHDMWGWANEFLFQF